MCGVVFRDNSFERLEDSRVPHYILVYRGGWELSMKPNLPKVWASTYHGTRNYPTTTKDRDTQHGVDSSNSTLVKITTLHTVLADAALERLVKLIACAICSNWTTHGVDAYKQQHNRYWQSAYVQRDSFCWISLVIEDCKCDKVLMQILDPVHTGHGNMLA